MRFLHPALIRSVLLGSALLIAAVPGISAAANAPSPTLSPASATVSANVSPNVPTGARVQTRKFVTQRRSAQGLQYVVTGEVTVTLPGRVAPAQPDSSQGSCTNDGSYSIAVCTTIVYSYYKASSGHNSASMSSTSSKYTRLDNSVSLQKGENKPFANGPCTRGCTGAPANNHLLVYSPPSSGHTYSWNVSWYGQYQEVFQPYAVQCANAILYWGHGTSSYSTSVEACASL